MDKRKPFVLRIKNVTGHQRWFFFDRADEVRAQLISELHDATNRIEGVVYRRGRLAWDNRATIAPLSYGLRTAEGWCRIAAVGSLGEFYDASEIDPQDIGLQPLNSNNFWSVRLEPRARRSNEL